MKNERRESTQKDLKKLHGPYWQPARKLMAKLMTAGTALEKANTLEICDDKT